jgi:CBS domain-containing protein
MFALCRCSAARSLRQTRTLGTRASLTVRDVLDEKRSFRAGEDLKIYLRKQFDLLTVDKGSSVASVLDKMVKGETNVLVVVDEHKAVAGLVTDRDYIKLAQSRNAGTGKKSDKEVLVDDIMTKQGQVVAVTNEDTVEKCQDLMVAKQVRHLPVLHNGKLHGVLSFVDFLHAPSRFEPESRRAIFAEEVGSPPARAPHG